MKKEVGIIDAVPSKRLFLSIIADYDINRSVCELIDNAIDIWIKNQKKIDLKIEIIADKNQQTLRVIDNAGGVIESELRFIVGPGQTSNLPTDGTIGIFGVGSKRAVVALAEDIRIISRYKKEKTHQIEFDEKWLECEDWELPYYEIDDIKEGTTIIELKRLRMAINEDILSRLEDHLCATYARFLVDPRISITLDKHELKPRFFNDWAYPPDFPPHKYTGKVKTEDGKNVRVEIIGGLGLISSPAGGEYGVYVYCNDRLIARGLKSYAVGFMKKYAGQPHPSVSLVRIIISLNGEAQLMPWNSSKSDINSSHNVFLAIRPFLLEVVKDYASLSKIWGGDWPDKVFKYNSGEMITIQVENFEEAKKSYLPPLPRSKPRYMDIVIEKNKKIAERKPWTKGIYEGIVATDMIFNQKKLEQKNRIALLVLDSTLEIAFKEYLVNDSGTQYGDHALLKLFSKRQDVHDEIKKYITFKSDIWSKIDYYYRMRCKLIHERITVNIRDDQIEDYRKIVQMVLKKLFQLKFDKQ